MITKVPIYDVNLVAMKLILKRYIRFPRILHTSEVMVSRDMLQDFVQQPNAMGENISFRALFNVRRIHCIMRELLIIPLCHVQLQSINRMRKYQPYGWFPSSSVNARYFENRNKRRPSCWQIFHLFERKHVFWFKFCCSLCTNIHLTTSWHWSS